MQLRKACWILVMVPGVVPTIHGSQNCRTVCRSSSTCCLEWNWTGLHWRPRWDAPGISQLWQLDYDKICFVLFSQHPLVVKCSSSFNLGTASKGVRGLYCMCGSLPIPDSRIVCWFCPGRDYKSVFWHKIYESLYPANSNSIQIECNSAIWSPRFEMRHGDADLLAMLDGGVPPPDLPKISIFAQHLSKYSTEARLFSDLSGCSIFLCSTSCSSPSNPIQSNKPSLRWKKRTWPKLKRSLAEPERQQSFCGWVKIKYVYLIKTNSSRLSEQLLKTTWQQLELQVEQDLCKLRHWSTMFDSFVGKQAGFCLEPFRLKPNQILCMIFQLRRRQ